MRFAWVAVALVASGCIEGDDPNSCAVDTDCSNGRLCSQMRHCEPSENLFDLTARWTLDGVAPTPVSPGRCTEFDGFKVGAGDAAGGFSAEAMCAEGVVQIPHVPTSMTTIEARAYKLASAGSSTVVGSAQVERAGASDVTLAFQLP
jgi:hypothetical protein